MSRLRAVFGVIGVGLVLFGCSSDSGGSSPVSSTKPGSATPSSSGKTLLLDAAGNAGQEFTAPGGTVRFEWNLSQASPGGAVVIRVKKKTDTIVEAVAASLETKLDGDQIKGVSTTELAKGTYSIEMVAPSEVFLKVYSVSGR